MIARGWIPESGSRSIVRRCGTALVRNVGFARYVTAAAARISTGSSPSSQQHELAIT
jgi:hypothetical protein